MSYPFGRRDDELVRVRGAGGLLDLRARRVEPAVAQVVGDGAREQHRLLRHDRDLLAQRADAVCADVHAVDQHAAGGRVVKARDQADERRLARAGQTDERDHLAGLGREVDVVQHAACRRDR